MKYLVRETRFENGELMLHLDGVGNILVPHTHTFASNFLYDYVHRQNLARTVSGQMKKNHVLVDSSVNAVIPGTDKPLPKEFVRGHYETQRRPFVRQLQWFHSDDERLEELVLYNTRMMDAINSVNHDNTLVQTRLRNNVARLTMPKGKYPNVKHLVRHLQSIKPGHVMLDTKRHRALSRIDSKFEVSDISLDDLLSLRTCYFDIEIPLYKTDPKISWIGLNFDGDEHIISLAENAKNETDLVRQTEALVERYDPIIMVAYNAKFDLGQLRERGLIVGNRDTGPVYQTATKFFERMGVRGREVLDPYRIMQQAVPILPNHKLDTTLQWAGFKFEKSLSYDEMAELEHAALAGDERAIKQIKTYLQGDVRALQDLWSSEKFSTILSDFLQLGTVAKQEFHRVTHSPSALDDTVALGHFQRCHAYPETFVKQTPDNIRHRNKQLRLFTHSHSSKSVQNNVHVLSVPYAFFMKDLLLRYAPNLEDLFTIKPEHRHLAVSQTNSLLKHLAMLHPGPVSVDPWPAYHQLSHWGKKHFDRGTLTQKKWREYSEIPLKDARYAMRMQKLSTQYRAAFKEDPRMLQERIEGVNQRCLDHLEYHGCTLHHAGKHWYVTGPSVFNRDHRSPLVPVTVLDNVLFTNNGPVYEMFGKLSKYEDKSVPSHTLTVHEQQILSNVVRGQLAGNTYRVNDVMDLFAWDTPENHVLFTKSTGDYTGFNPSRTRFSQLPSLQELSESVYKDRLYKRLKEVMV